MIWTEELLVHNATQKVTNHLNQSIILLRWTNGYWSVKRWDRDVKKMMKGKALVSCSDPDVICDWLERNGYSA